MDPLANGAMCLAHLSTMVNPALSGPIIILIVKGTYLDRSQWYFIPTKYYQLVLIFVFFYI